MKTPSAQESASSQILLMLENLRACIVECESHGVSGTESVRVELQSLREEVSANALVSGRDQMLDELRKSPRHNPFHFVDVAFFTSGHPHGPTRARVDPYGPSTMDQVVAL